MTFPRSLKDVTPELLSELLSKRWPGIAVSSMVIDGKIHGTATKARLRLTYAGNTDAPTVMWLKAGFEDHSERMAKVGIYAREPHVYWEVLPDLPVNTPVCYGAAYDESTYQGVVLLEDLSRIGATLHTPKSSISIEQVKDMVAMLAAMHAKTMSPHSLALRPWIEPVFAEYDDPEGYLAQVSAPQALEQFLKQPRCVHYPAQMFDAGAIHKSLNRMARWLVTATPKSMLHGDAHIGNSYSDAQGQAGLLDWQCVRLGHWAYDITYYLVSALDVATRRSSERAIIEFYLERLEAAGGPRIDWDTAWQAYQECFVYGFVAWLSNATQFQPEDYNEIVSTRFALAMVDHNMI